MKKGIIINFPQTNKDGPGSEIEFKEVTDELCKCDKCGKILCHGEECGQCVREELKISKEVEKEEKKSKS